MHRHDAPPPLSGELHRLESLFRERESEMLAFVPEEGRFERLFRAARELSDLYPDPASRPPLFGRLVGVKDALHVDGFTTLAGSRLPAEALAGREAAAVSALKKAGVLILGKTVTTEFTYFAAGPTRNPHHLEHTPGGSSSGSAAAVGAGLCPIALGTQTIGSILRPAAYCGVVGFKASYGRISTEGTVPLAPSFDHVGFFTPDAATAERVAEILVSSWSPGAPPCPRPVLAIPEGPYLAHASSEGLEHFRATCRKLEAAGYVVKSVDAFADFDEIRARHDLVVAAEAAKVHESWFPRFHELYRPQTAELIRRGQKIDAGELRAARAGCRALREELHELMDEHEFDLFLSPAAPGTAPAGLGWTGDPVMNLPFTQSGLPALALPSGRGADGLPLALQLVARGQRDEALLAWSKAIEEVLR